MLQLREAATTWLLQRRTYSSAGETREARFAPAFRHFRGGRQKGPLKVEDGAHIKALIVLELELEHSKREPGCIDHMKW